MLECASNKRRNWSTESLMEGQSVWPHLHPCLRWCLHVKTLTDPSRSHDPFYPQSQLPLSFLSTTLPFCSCPSNEEVRHRHRHNTPLHKEGMSVCQMGRGDYNMFPLPWWLNGAGMRTHLIQAGSFPWQNYESQFLGRKCTYQHLGEGDLRVNTKRSLRKAAPPG